METIVTTDRLHVHTWRDEDRAPLADLLADPEVMRFFPSTMTREQSDRWVDLLRERQERDGLCIWAVNLRDSGEFVGMVGLQTLDYLSPEVPTAVEVGWRLARRHWGKGYATEAATGCLKYGFEERGFEEIIAIASEKNLPSLRVMDRIGMQRDPEADFLHPRLEEDNPFRPHVLYRAKPNG